jgi:cytochrome c peroxidase
MADSATDYALHPNGRLPDTTLTTRGRDLLAGNTTCRSCHTAAAGRDFLFHK